MSSGDQTRKGDADSAARGLLDLVQDDSGAEPNERAEDIATQSASLRAALGGGDLDGADHEALLALALGEDVAEHDDDEQREAEALRQALDGAGGHALAGWANQLRYAWEAPEPLAHADLAHADHEALLALALGVEAELDAPLAAQAEQDDAELSAWTTALRAAWQPEAYALEDADHAALLALGGLDEALIDATESAEADALRQALEQDGSHPLAQLATAVRHAAEPAALDQLAYERILSRALSSAESGDEGSSDKLVAEAPRNVVQLRAKRNALLTAVVAMAAAIALFVGSLSLLETRPDGVAKAPQAEATSAGVAMAVSRSTTELFDPMTPFPRKGGESERMKRIVASRSADLRANRFAAWGVR